MTDSGRTRDAETPNRSGPSLTPRQAEVLDLARIGLSDGEIAARLKVSPRTVRFALEKVFLELGVRDRAEAVTVWSGSRRPVSRFLDRCPYHRPFPPHFGDCPAYRAVRVATLNVEGRPTGSVWTCHHLEAKPIPETESGWYAGCAIGGPAARERWAVEVAGLDRLQLINRVADDLAWLAGPTIERLWELKHEQRGAVERGQDPTEPTRRMEALRDRFIKDVESLLQDRRPALERHRLSASACLDVARRAIDGILSIQTRTGWNVRFDILLGLPEEAWLG